MDKKSIYEGICYVLDNKLKSYTFLASSNLCMGYDNCEYAIIDIHYPVQIVETSLPLHGILILN